MINEIEPIPRPLSENELKKLSDNEFDEYCSKIIKELVKSFEEVGEFENY